ncbi:MAG: OB-fold nucleic acid binding domain-containing protein [Clostridia bacterium]|nr:OB-fold nucleic acid binding domain-containing protein [Clostridia bacterium]
MNSVLGNPGKIAGYIQYCRSHGIRVAPPDVNRSGWKFTVKVDEDGSQYIIFGLGAVKNVGENAVEAIIRERNINPYKDIFDFCGRVDTQQVNKRVVESLISCGAFDFTGARRTQMMAVYETELDGNINRRKTNVLGQVSLFDMAFGDEMLQTAAPSVLPNLPDYEPMVRLAMEKAYTGVYITGHPLEGVRSVLDKLKFSTKDLAGLEENPDLAVELDGQMVDMGGILVESKGKATKKGAFMGFCTLEDLTGQIECLVFPKVYERCQSQLNTDALVVLTGKLSIREEEAPKLLVERVTPLEDWESQAPLRRELERAQRGFARKPQPQKTDAQLAKESPKKLYLKLSRPQMDDAMALLNTSRGNTPVYLHIPEEKMTFLAPKTGWCEPDADLLQKLVTVFGEANVKLVETAFG